MKLISQNTLQMFSGVVVAAALALLTVAVFALFAHEGPWRTLEYLVRRLETPLPSPAPVTRSSSPASTPAPSPQAAAPAPSGGGGGNGGGGGGGGGGAATGGIASGAAPGAAAALRQVLSEYRDNPNATTTVTVSSGGQISTGHEGGLTVQDGMPAQAYRDGTIMTGERR